MIPLIGVQNCWTLQRPCHLLVPEAPGLTAACSTSERGYNLLWCLWEDLHWVSSTKKVVRMDSSGDGLGRGWKTFFFLCYTRVCPIAGSWVTEQQHGDFIFQLFGFSHTWWFLQYLIPSIEFDEAGRMMARKIYINPQSTNSIIISWEMSALFRRAS